MDYQSLLNETVMAIKPSGIRRFFDIANEMQDVISLSIGEPDFSTPWHVRQKGIETLEKGKTWYSPNRGFAGAAGRNFPVAGKKIRPSLRSSKKRAGYRRRF